MRQSTQEPGVLAMLGGALRDGAIFAIKHPGKALTMMLAIQSRAVAAQQNHSSLAWAQHHALYVDPCINARWNGTTGDMQMNSDYLDEAKEHGVRGVRLAFIALLLALAFIALLVAWINVGVKLGPMRKSTACIEYIGRSILQRLETSIIEDLSL